MVFRFVPRAALILASVSLLPAQASWRGWESYHTIMWSTGNPAVHAQWIERLRETGFTAEQRGAGLDATPYLLSRFGFYVENLIPELAFHHSRRAIYDADWEAYTTTRDKGPLIRKPCLHDPDFWSTATNRLRLLVHPYTAQKPLLYNLRDEPSLGAFAGPMDYCFGPHTLREFREWLQQEYGTLEALNAEWETAFSSWAQVVPMTTYEVFCGARRYVASGGALSRRRGNSRAVGHIMSQGRPTRVLFGASASRSSVAWRNARPSSKEHCRRSRRLKPS